MRKGLTAQQFMATLSTAGREESKPLPAPLNHPTTMEVERWEDGQWVTRTLVWNARFEQYREFVNDLEATNV